MTEPIIKGLPPCGSDVLLISLILGKCDAGVISNSKGGSKMLVKGQKVSLENQNLKIQFKDAELSFVCIALNESSKSEGVFTPQQNISNYVIFEKNSLLVNVGQIPANISRIALAIMSPSKYSVGIADVECGNLKDSYNFAGEINNRSDAILFEVYKKDGKWKLSIDGRYFENNIAMMGAFGAVLPAPVVKPESGKVSLSKVVLAKRGDLKVISLDKKDKKIYINLNWDSGNNVGEKKGFFASMFNSNNGAVDLDLGCMFETIDGLKGVIQPLGGNFGARDDSPFIFLDKDDRSGTATDGENMYIFKPEHIQRVLVFAFIYEGTAEFSKVNAILTIRTSTEEILIELNNPDSSSKFCAVAMFKNDGQKLSLSKEERYFHGHKDCDEHYNFGFKWVAGKK